MQRAPVAVVASAIFLVAAILVPSASAPSPSRWRRPSPTKARSTARILLEARLPRVLLGAVAGGGLAMVGVAFQAVLRNPLAEPYVLGVSGGAALGATLAILPGVTGATMLGASVVPLAALVGGLAATALVYGLARGGAGMSATSMLLAASSSTRSPRPPSPS